MTGSWGWAHVQKGRVQFSKRTYPTAAQARDGLQDHLDVQDGEDTRDAATRLRALPARPDDVSVHIPGRSWYVRETHKDIRVFAGDTVHTFRRPVSTAQQAPAATAADRGALKAPKPMGKRRTAAVDATRGQMAVQVFGFSIGVLGGASVLFSDSTPEGNRPWGLLLIAVGIALMFNRAIWKKLSLGP
ncbi:hypothetical protein YW5DRAFT_02730 [Streptomyces sp. Ncost-T6T-1]|uniref:hypothetical protein n=1 Tax=Streptomyces sp. Ncost-T6T-1 TaxID=1100828 RepID=UPI000805C958|nr:hypothetical protein [Streptomyces sp. Ncost-T6T-1]SBV05045.1 hypothetical protein YW5DRAFT_02730 [Streptomyces sp. Ncost-T6T-1]